LLFDESKRSDAYVRTNMIPDNTVHKTLIASLGFLISQTNYSSLAVCTYKLAHRNQVGEKACPTSVCHK